jgi:hypothetical protein
MTFKRFPLSILLLLLLAGCATRSGTFESKHGSYTISIKKTDSITKPPVIYGDVFEYDTKLPSFGLIWANKDPYRMTSEIGKYAFELKPGKYNFTSGYLGFFKVKSRAVKISNGEKVKIDFYLKADETPMNCQ